MYRRPARLRADTTHLTCWTVTSLIYCRRLMAVSWRWLSKKYRCQQQWTTSVSGQRWDGGKSFYPEMCILLHVLLYDNGAWTVQLILIILSYNDDLFCCDQLIGFPLLQIWQGIWQVRATQQGMDQGEDLHVAKAAGGQGVVIVMVGCLWPKVLKTDSRLTNSAGLIHVPRCVELAFANHKLSDFCVW